MTRAGPESSSTKWEFNYITYYRENVVDVFFEALLEVAPVIVIWNSFGKYRILSKFDFKLRKFFLGFSMNENYYVLRNNRIVRIYSYNFRCYTTRDPA